MTPWLDPDTGLPGDDPGGPLTEWSDPVPTDLPPARMVSDLGSLLLGAIRTGMVAPLADYLAERVPDMEVGDVIRAECKPWDLPPVLLTAWPSVTGHFGVWVALDGGTPRRFRDFDPADFARPFAEWLTGVYADDWWHRT